MLNANNKGDLKPKFLPEIIWANFQCAKYLKQCDLATPFYTKTCESSQNS